MMVEGEKRRIGGKGWEGWGGGVVVEGGGEEWG